MGNKKSSDAEAIVEDAIATNPVVIFSKSYCPYCHSAKADIARAATAITNFTPPKVFELDRMSVQGRAIQAYLATKTGRRTVPNVFVGGVSVGGGDEVASYARRNLLKQMLTQAPDRLAATYPPPKHPDSADVLVERAITDHPVVVFSKSWCPYCHTAKAHIARAADAIPTFTAANVFELDQMGQRGDQIQAYLTKKTGRHTVPNVFIAGVSVGGGDEVAALAASDALVPRIAAAVQPGAPATDAHCATEIPSAAENSRADSTAPAQNLVEDAITSNPVVIFSKSFCPFCSAAKSNIATIGEDVPAFQPAKVFELDTMGPEGEDVQRYLAEKTGRATVPNVFIAGKSVGGGDDISAYANSGDLRQMLADAIATSNQTETPFVGKDASLTTGPATKELVFGAGCFWGVELAFQRVVGVVNTEVGYSNGRLARVTYDAVCSGLTGSAEVVLVTYDPAVVSLTKLLAVWESRHDPTSLNKQGNDAGTQYRSALFYNDDQQKAEIDRWSADASARFSKPVVTDIAPVNNYCTAESYHQRYLEKKGQSAEKGSIANIRCYG